MRIVEVLIPLPIRRSLGNLLLRWKRRLNEIRIEPWFSKVRCTGSPRRTDPWLCLLATLAIGPVGSRLVRTFTRPPKRPPGTRHTSKQRLLILRDQKYQHRFNDCVLCWAAVNANEIWRRMEVRTLPCELRDWTPYGVYIPWLQDPVRRWSDTAYQHAKRLEAECAARNIPVINPVDQTENVVRIEFARRMHAVNVRTPRVFPIVDRTTFAESHDSLPVIIRETWGHQKTLRLARTREELRGIDLSAFREPVAAEFIDVRSPQDGLFRKYRYFAAGDTGLSLHLQVTESWVSRGNERILTDATREEECAFIDHQDPNHDLLQRARKALELDVVAFDYSYDPQGNIVVWEANPLPYIRISSQRLSYRNHTIHRAFAAMLKLYLERAELPVPASIAELAGYAAAA